MITTSDSWNERQWKKFPKNTCRLISWSIFSSCYNSKNYQNWNYFLKCYQFERRAMNNEVASNKKKLLSIKNIHTIKGEREEREPARRMEKINFSEIWWKKWINKWRKHKGNVEKLKRKEKKVKENENQRNQEEKIRKLKIVKKKKKSCVR